MKGDKFCVFTCEKCTCARGHGTLGSREEYLNTKITHDGVSNADYIKSLENRAKVLRNKINEIDEFHHKEI